MKMYMLTRERAERRKRRKGGSEEEGGGGWKSANENENPHTEVVGTTIVFSLIEAPRIFRLPNHTRVERENST